MLPVLKYWRQKTTRIDVSLVVSILNSHEIVRRHLLFFEKMPLPDWAEVIYMDDGSDPPLVTLVSDNLDINLSIYETKDYRKWTQPRAENFGARRAVGEFMIHTDIDCIVDLKLFEAARNCPFDNLRLSRSGAVLDENGEFVRDHDTMREYGMREKFIKRNLRMSPHGNSYIIRRSLFLDIGGVDERYAGTGKYPNRQEVTLKRALHKLRHAGEITIHDKRPKPTIYMFPVGRYGGGKDFNPKGLFHNVTRYTNKERRRMKEK